MTCTNSPGPGWMTVRSSFDSAKWPTRFIAGAVHLPGTRRVSSTTWGWCWAWSALRASSTGRIHSPWSIVWPASVSDGLQVTVGSGGRVGLAAVSSPAGFCAAGAHETARTATTSSAARRIGDEVMDRHLHGDGADIPSGGTLAGSVPFCNSLVSAPAHQSRGSAHPLEAHLGGLPVGLVPFPLGLLPHADEPGARLLDLADHLVAEADLV